MIPLPLYVGFPALLALLLILALRFSLAWQPRQAAAVLWSYRLAWAHLGAALLSVLLTASDPISGLACRTAIVGFYASIAVAMLDGLCLLWWCLGIARTARAGELLRPALFIFLRMLAHAALAGTFLWCSMLCTV